MRKVDFGQWLAVGANIEYVERMQRQLEERFGTRNVQ